MFFRSRQLHGFVLTVEVVRVGDLASPAVDAPDGAYEATPASRRASLCPGGIEPDSAAGKVVADWLSGARRRAAVQQAAVVAGAHAQLLAVQPERA